MKYNKIEKINEETWIGVHTERTAGATISKKMFEVKKPAVDFLYELLKEINEVKETDEEYIDYTTLVSNIIYKKKIHIAEHQSLNNMIGAFNGGSNRRKYYFPLYYYPLVILEFEGLIERKGRGKVKFV